MKEDSLCFSFLYYRDKILSMRVARQRGVINIAKPILLISIFNCIERGFFVENKIYYNDVLINSYLCHYEKYKRDNNVTQICYPFYYLRNDDFYHLEEIKSIKRKTPSDKFIRENIKYAKFDDELWILLQNSGYREKLKEIILNFYIK